MRRFLPILSILTVLGVALVLGSGCGGDDDPTDPGEAACGIKLTGPAPGSAFTTNDVEAITWNASGGGMVRVILRKSGADVGEIWETANDGRYNWTVRTLGAPSGADYEIAVVSSTDDACADTLGPYTLTNTEGCAFDVTLNADFTDTALVVADEILPIRWVSESTTGTVDIELWRAPLELVRVGIIAYDAPDNGVYDWTVDSFHMGTQIKYFIRIIDSGRNPPLEPCFDDSPRFAIEDDENCEIIVQSPSDIDVWDEGTTQTVMFSAAGTTGATLNASLYAGFTEYLGPIAAGVAHDAGSFTWQVDDFGWGDTNSNVLYRIRVYDPSDTYCEGWSDKFTIVPD